MKALEFENALETFCDFAIENKLSGEIIIESSHDLTADELNELDEIDSSMWPYCGYTLKSGGDSVGLVYDADKHHLRLHFDFFSEPLYPENDIRGMKRG
jgi:hypothetical protein